VDIGNSKSHALIADESGRILGSGTAGAGSWEAIGWEGARRVIHALVGQALRQAGIRSQQVAAAGFGLAGYDWPEDREPYVQIISSLKLGGPFELFNDAMIGLFIGASDGWGVCVSAGTSCNCYGRDQNGRIGRVTGDSSRFAEYGGAHEIVVRAVQAVALQWTQRGPQTRLSDAFVALCGAADVEDLLAGLVRDRYGIGPANAPLVFEVATQGDEVAQEIIAWAGRELGSLANGVIRQLGFEALSFDVVLTGSVYDHNESLLLATEQSIIAAAPGARMVSLQAPPVLGGLILAMEQLGLDPHPARKRLLLHATNDLFAGS
ncbi:MAG: BadF/BadG/BcrA/BcrD ATPase family protein, partial [Anaerolineae bacterium]|nr:BadF/BadG/BcrA/BcrD ATPase family protein [Anaerolineae bacterium]